jgi:DNA-binding GntR family transcriptional regulator
MLELYEVRAALEEFAARIATPRLRDDVAELQAEVDAMADAAVRNDVHAAVEHSERFHRLIVEGSGNQLLYTMWSSLSITDHTALTMVTLSLDLDTLAESHQPIVDAIAAGDVELACRVSREHQDWFVEMLEATASRTAADERAAEELEDAVSEAAPLPSA